MNPLLKKFRDEFANQVLQLLWRQWNAMGVSGSEPTWSGATIDPDALLIFSLHAARHDARLFQEMIDWLVKNGSLINIQRVNNMIQKRSFAGAKTLAPVAALLTESDSSQQLKWKRLAKQPAELGSEPLFFLMDGRPLPAPQERDSRFEQYGFLSPALSLRGYSRPFDPTLPANRLLTYRSFFGVNSRSELLCVLGSLDGVTAARAARLTGYSPRSIQNVLAEMAASNWIESFSSGRDKIYSLKKNPHLDGLFKPENPSAGWAVWPAIFQTLEIVWRRLFSGELDELDELSLDSEGFQLWKECRTTLSSEALNPPSLPAPPKTLHGAFDGFTTALQSTLNTLKQ
jgi:hypothetical protein